MLLQCDSIRASEPAQAIQKKPAQANPRKTSRKASALSDARHPRKIRRTVFYIEHSIMNNIMYIFFQNNGGALLILDSIETLYFLSCVDALRHSRHFPCAKSCAGLLTRVNPGLLARVRWRGCHYIIIS